MTSKATLLELRDVDKSFGGLRVIADLDLVVREHEIVSVIGPNGAGKTTLFNLVTGIYRPDSGEIQLDGRNIVGMAPHKITELGIARTFQTLRLFLNMTVKENVMAAQYGHTKVGVLRSMVRTPGARREEKEIHRLAEEKLAFFGDRLMGIAGTSRPTACRMQTAGGSRSRERWRPKRASCSSMSPPPG